MHDGFHIHRNIIKQTLLRAKGEALAIRILRTSSTTLGDSSDIAAFLISVRDHSMIITLDTTQ